MSIDLFINGVIENWTIWLVTVILIVAATIDGIQLKVPNWITYPMILAGICYWTIADGWEGLGYSLLGMVIGLALLLPLYAIGGMGAGDVKLLAGVGAWVGATVTFWAFMVSIIVGAIIAIGMVLYKKEWSKHFNQFFHITKEIIVIKDPEKLSEIAAERKPSMLLLPYGIPIAIGTILYFGFTGMLI